jgi:vacuolar-type H+-ATPase subunit I/STV1
MKIWKLALFVICAAFFAKLGAQALVSAFMVAVIVRVGPARMKSLPRAAREEAAVHLLAMLGAAVMAIGLACAASVIDFPELATMASLGAWLSVGVVFAFAAFHLTCFPLRPNMRGQVAVKTAVDSEKTLPWAS